MSFVKNLSRSPSVRAAQDHLCNYSFVPLINYDVNFVKQQLSAATHSSPPLRVLSKSGWAQLRLRHTAGLHRCTFQLLNRSDDTVTLSTMSLRSWTGLLTRIQACQITGYNVQQALAPCGAMLPATVAHLQQAQPAPMLSQWFNLLQESLWLATPKKKV